MLWHGCCCTWLLQVPVAHGKADLTIYREAGAAVINVLSHSEFDIIVERASIDEAYLDVTAGAQQLLVKASAAKQVHSQQPGQQQLKAQQEQEQQEQQQQDQHQGPQAGPVLPAVQQTAADMHVGLLPPPPASFQGWHVAGEVGHGWLLVVATKGCWAVCTCFALNSHQQLKLQQANRQRPSSNDFDFSHQWLTSSCKWLEDLCHHLHSH
jgi:hypothetical protein